jgi:hypothetical protein
MKHEAVTPEYRYQIERRRDYSERIENGGRSVRLVDEPAKDEPWTPFDNVLCFAPASALGGMIGWWLAGGGK